MHRVEVTMEVMIRLTEDSSKAFLAAGITSTGCNIAKTSGIFVTLDSSTNSVVIYEDLGMN